MAPKSKANSLGSWSISSEDLVNSLRPVVAGESSYAIISDEAAAIVRIEQHTWHPLRDFVGSTNAFLLAVAAPQDVGKWSDSLFPLIAVQSASSNEIVHGYGTNNALVDKKAASNVSGISITHSAYRTDMATSLPLQVTRNLLSLYASVCMDRLIESELPMFALTSTHDGQEPQYLAVQSCFPTSGGSQITYRSYNINDKGVSTLQGSNRAQQVLSGFLSESSSQTYQCFARYEMVGSFAIKSDLAPTSCVVLETSWRGPRPTTLLAYPPTSANATLIVRGVPRSIDPENYSATLRLTRELDRLQALRDHLAKLGDDGLLVESLVLGGKGVNQSALDAFIQELQTSPANKATSTTDDTNLDVCGEYFSELKRREDLDFSERLWLICLDCADSDEVGLVLSQSFGAVENGTIKPLIHRGNNSSLGGVLRDALRLGRMQTAKDVADLKGSVSRAFDHWHDHPLECLLDIGLAKVKRDYAHHLVGADLLSWSQLSSFLGDGSENFDIQLSRVQAVHRLLEISMLARQGVSNMPFEFQRSLVKTIMDACQLNADAFADSSNTLQIIFPLPKFAASTASVVAHVTQRVEPSEWSLGTSSSNKTVKILRLSKSEDLFTPAIVNDIADENSVFGICTATIDTTEWSA